MDELVRTRPAAEPTVGPAGREADDRNTVDPQAEAPPPDFEVARRRLGRASRNAADRLADRLDRVVELYGLDRRELAAAQRQIRRLRRAGLVPSANEYWESTAVPRAEMLLDTSMGAIAEEADRLTDAVDRFLVATSRSTLEPWISGADGRAAIQRSGRDAVDRFLAALPPSDPIDELGEWWQRQLHRRAAVLALPRLLTSRDSTEQIVGRIELDLLDSSPWCYGDRLLSAFELAQAEIRNRAGERADDVLAAVAKRGHGALVDPGQGGRAVIKLSG
ncbi:MAG: hypothetical protein AAGA93_17755 [Actinomycetota bacterium]